MSRPRSAQQQALLDNEVGYTTHARVLVDNGMGTAWLNLSDLGTGLDFFESATVEESLESPHAQAQVRVKREVDGWKLSPLVSGSPLVGVLDLGRAFKVEVALAPIGTPTGITLEWEEIFSGRIDNLDLNSNPITFGGRSAASVLQDVQMTGEQVLGADDGSVSLESVITTLVNSIGAPGLSNLYLPLYTPVSPGFAVGRYLQRVEPPFDAAQVLATQIGWEVRWRWSEADQRYRFTLQVPDRAKTVPDWVVPAHGYDNLQGAELTYDSLRTQVRVTYSDSADLDVSGVPKRKTATATADANTLAKYGYLGQPVPRVMDIAEASTSAINTAGEAQTLANAALSDLSAPPFVVSFRTLGMHPFVELGDLVRLEANEWVWDVSQDGAIVAVRHELAGETCRTTVQIQGKPSISRRLWLERDARPGVAPPPPFTGPSPVEGLAATTTVNGTYLRWTAALGGPRATSYEVHLSTSSGFTPGTNTLQGTANGVQQPGGVVSFELSTLLAGVVYYAKVVALDEKGNRGSPSAEVSFTTKYLEPRSIQPQVTYATFNTNAQFEAWNGGSTVTPDAWFATDSSVIGVNVLQSSLSASGAFGVHFPPATGNPTRTLSTNRLAIVAGTTYAIQTEWLFSGGPVWSNNALVRVEFLRQDGTLIGSTSKTYSASGFTPSVFERRTFFVVIPAASGINTPAYMRIAVGVQTNGSGSSSGSVYLDNAIVLTTAGEQTLIASASLNNSQVIQNGLYTRVAYDTTVEDKFGVLTLVSPFAYTAPVPGVYHFSASTTFLSVPNGTDVISAWTVDGVIVRRASRYSATSGFAGLDGSATLRLAAGSVVDYRVYQASGAALALEGGGSGWFSGMRIGA